MIAKVVDHIGRFFVGFISRASSAASFSLFLVLIFVTSDVIGRVIFNRPITGVSEIVKVGIVGLVFMQIPWALYTNRHIHSDLIAGRLGEGGKKTIALFRNIISFCVFMLLFVANWSPMLHSWRIREYEGEGAFHVPVYPLYLIIQISSLVAACISLRRIVDGIRSIFSKPG